MREILFRGKRVDNGEWVEGYLSFVYIDVPEKARIYSPAKVRSFDVITETVGQYTGLKDKNGLTKIFEGDIVRGNHKYFGNGSSIQRAVVLFDGGQYSFAFGDSLEECENFEDIEVVGVWCNDVEVIGNIHDNPEMVKGDA